MQKKKLPIGSFFSYSNHAGLAEQECLTVLDNNTTIGLIHWTTKDIIHRSIEVESSLGGHVLNSSRIVCWSICESSLSRNDDGVVGCRHGNQCNMVISYCYEATCIVEAQLTNYAQVVLE